MNCPDEQLLSARREGALDAAAVRAIDEHLASCTSCQIRSGSDALSQTDRRGPGSRAPGEFLGEGGRFGRYVLLDQLGAGGMGVVYGAYDPHLDRRVALKLLRAQATDSATEKKRMWREAQAMARLSHPNVIGVHDVGLFDGQIVIAMEFVDGGSLGDWLRAAPRDWRAVRDAFVLAGRGLSAAHRAGVIHRDFKPDNVLVGKDGRVQVTDFGLARAADELEGALGSLASQHGMDQSQALLTPVTHAGTVLGTPAYMSPEQLRGERADERSDQFSFCVSLYEGLYGRRPFVGATFGELSQAIARGELPDPPRDSKVPLWLRRAVLRGLQGEPKDRYSSIDALLGALERDPGEVRRGRLGVAAAIVVVFGVVVALPSVAQKQGSRCDGAATAFGDTWSEARQRAVREAFFSSTAPYREAAWEGIRAALDRHAEGWTSMHRETCEATWVRGVQSGELLDLRMACLERRREEAAALVDVFSRADETVVENAVKAAGQLSLSACREERHLRARQANPGPMDAGAVAEARAQLAPAAALRLTGKLPEALTLSRSATLAARSTGYPLVVAEALVLEGTLQHERGEYVEAEQTLEEAYTIAETFGDDRTKLQATIPLAEAVGKGLSRHADGERWGRIGAATLVRIGGDDALAASLSTSRGVVAFSAGRYVEAERLQREALGILERLHETEHPQIAATLRYLGIAIGGRGDLAESMHTFERVLPMQEKLLGTDHPDVAKTLNTIGTLLDDRGDYDAALDRYRRAQRIAEATLGKDHYYVGYILANTGEVLVKRGQYEEALALFEQVLKDKQTRGGVDAPEAAYEYSSIGLLYTRLGRFEEAERLLLRALTLREKTFGADHHRPAQSHIDLGHHYLSRGKPKAALEHYARGREIIERRLGVDHVDLVAALIGEGEALLALGDPGAALPALTRAEALFQHSSLEPVQLAALRFATARVRHALDRDRPAARRLAEEAAATFRQVGGAYGRELAEVERWLKSSAHGR